jgi:predicted transport protein
LDNIIDMNLKTKDEIIKINMTTSELSLIVEHMYFNLANVTENFTENMKIYDKDVKFYKYLKNLLRK